MIITNKLCRYKYRFHKHSYEEEDLEVLEYLEDKSIDFGEL
jgi:hypothetical protein